MNKNLNNPIHTLRHRWRLAVVAFALSALSLALPLLTTVAYACQSQGSGC